MPQANDPLLPLTARIVSAHVAHNETPSQALPGLIQEVYRALASANAEAAAPVPPPRTQTRKAPAGGTMFDDHLICQECGLHMKMLKRHLQTVHNIAPAEYRAKWRLPGDYPMVAREYAALRSNLAKASGLGKRPVP